MSEYTKKELRMQMKLKRDNLTETDVKDAGLAVLTRLSTLTAYCEADVIFMYFPIKNELDVLQVFKAAAAVGKTIAFPRINNKDLEFYIVHDLSECKPGYQSIPEPPTMETYHFNDTDNVLILIPGLVFNEQRDRIGYGGGYYDRYLASHGFRFTKKIALAYEFQVISDSFSVEITDIRPDMIITPERIIS